MKRRPKFADLRAALLLAVPDIELVEMGPELWIHVRLRNPTPERHDAVQHVLDAYRVVHEQPAKFMVSWQDTEVWFLERSSFSDLKR